MGNCKVTVNGVTVEYEKGSKYLEIAEDYKDKVNGDIALKIRNKQVKNIEVYIE